MSDLNGIPLEVTLIAQTQWVPEGLEQVKDTTGWEPEGSAGQGEEIVEFAGRECYQSWEKPNPRTASSTGYLEHIVAVGHESVLEHINFTVRITGVSRSLTHELVRHRHFSYSQLSQRYVPSPLHGVVVPPLFRGDSVAEAILEHVRAVCTQAYTDLSEHGEDLLQLGGVEGLAKRKGAREAARAVLPNMTPTQIVVTGNWRAWRWFLVKRDDPAADMEIQELAIAVRRVLEEAAGKTALTGTERRP